jgi:hypothetical protein
MNTNRELQGLVRTREQQETRRQCNVATASRLVASSFVLAVTIAKLSLGVLALVNAQ